MIGFIPDARHKNGDSRRDDLGNSITHARQKRTCETMRLSYDGSSTLRRFCGALDRMCVLFCGRWMWGTDSLSAELRQCTRHAFSEGRDVETWTGKATNRRNGNDVWRGHAMRVHPSKHQNAVITANLSHFFDANAQIDRTTSHRGTRGTLWPCMLDRIASASLTPNFVLRTIRQTPVHSEDLTRDHFHLGEVQTERTRVGRAKTNPSTSLAIPFG